MNSLDGEAWRISDDEQRASFEVVELGALPAVPVDLDVPPGDWLAIAAAGVEYVESGGDPVDGATVNAFASSRLPRMEDRFELGRLFADPIVCGPSDKRFTNGRHRVNAMSLAGVERCVVYTKAGERALGE